MDNNEFSPVARAPRVSLFDGKALRFSTSTRTYNSSSCSSTGSSACSSRSKTSVTSNNKYRYLYNNDNEMRGYNNNNRCGSSKNNYNQPEYLYHGSTSRSQSQETLTDDADERDTEIKHCSSNSHWHRSTDQTREAGPTAKNVNQSILDMLLSIAQSTNVKKTSQGTSIRNDKIENMSLDKEMYANNSNKPSITNIGLNTSHEFSYGCSNDINNNEKEKYSELEEMCNLSHSQDDDLANRWKLEQKESENQLSLRSSHKELVEINAENKERWALCVEWQRKAQVAEEEAMRWHTTLMNERSMQENAIKELSEKALMAEESVQHAKSELETLSEKLNTMESTLVMREAALEEVARCNKATILDKELLEKEHKALMEQVDRLESENKHLTQRCQESAKEYVKLQSNNMKLSAQIDALQASHRLERHQEYVQDSKETQQQEKHNLLDEKHEEQTQLITEKVSESEKDNHNIMNTHYTCSNNDVNDSYNKTANQLLLEEEEKDKNEELELANTRLEARLSATMNELHQFISNDVEMKLIIKEIAKRAENVLHLIEESVNKSDEHLVHKSFDVNTSHENTFESCSKENNQEASKLSNTEYGEPSHNVVRPCASMAKSICNALDAMILFVKEHEELAKIIRTKECEHHVKNIESSSNNVMFQQEQNNAIKQENKVLVQQISVLQETLENLQIKLNEWRTEETDSLYFLEKQNDMLCRALCDCHKVVYGNLSNQNKFIRRRHNNLLTSNKSKQLYRTNAPCEHNTSREDQLTLEVQQEKPLEKLEEEEQIEEELEESLSEHNVKTLSKTNYYNTCTVLSIIRELKQQVRLWKEQQKKIKAEASEAQQMQQSKAEERVIALAHELHLSRDLVQKLKAENVNLQSKEEELYKNYESKLRAKEVELCNASNKIVELQTELSALRETNSHLEQKLLMQQQELQCLQEREHQLSLHPTEVAKSDNNDNNSSTNYDLQSKLQTAFLEAIQCIMLLERKVNYWQVHKRLMWHMYVCKERELTVFHHYVDHLSNNTSNNTTTVSKMPFPDEINDNVRKAENAKCDKRSCLRIAVHAVRAMIRLQKLMMQTAQKFQIVQKTTTNLWNFCTHNEEPLVQIAKSNTTFVSWLDRLLHSAVATQNLPKLILSLESMQRNTTHTINSVNDEQSVSSSPCENLFDALQYVYVANTVTMSEKLIDSNNVNSDGSNRSCAEWNALQQLDEYITQLRSECTQCKEKYHLNEEDMCVLLEQNNTLSTMLCCVENERNALQEQLQSLHKELESKEELMEHVGNLQRQLEQVNSRLEGEQIAHRSAQEHVDNSRKEEVKLLLEIEELKNVIRVLQCRLHESLLQTEFVKALPGMHHKLQLTSLQKKEEEESENVKLIETQNYVTKNEANECTASRTKNVTVNNVSEIEHIIKDLVHTPKPQLLPHHYNNNSKQKEKSSSLLLQYLHSSSATPPSLQKTTESSSSSTTSSYKPNTLETLTQA